MTITHVELGDIPIPKGDHEGMPLFFQYICHNEITDQIEFVLFNGKKGFFDVADVFPWIKKRKILAVIKGEIDYLGKICLERHFPR